MPDAKNVFNTIINSQSEAPLAVFDLDSTLYNVSHRTQQIILDFMSESKYQKDFPNEVEFLNHVKITSRDWGLKEALIRAGLVSTENFYRTIRYYWETHFFSSPYLDFDKPYEGAVDYVQALHSQGIVIKYLTGRDAKNMKAGTLKSLKKHKFPLQNEMDDLIMKPVKGQMEDEDFKSDKFNNLLSISNNIWFFENEPVIIHKVKVAFPQIKIVWIDTTHSRRQAPPEEIFVIQDKWTR